jgi:hypothetical protein
VPDETAQGTPDLARVTELIKAADRLGLTWGLRPGTVVLTTSPYSPREASVRMDGDDGNITVVSLIGDMAVGDRVMVMHVPPAGEYTIGFLNRPSSAIFTQASTSDTANIIAETVTFTLPSVTLEFGAAYRVEGGNRINAGAAAAATYRLRKTNIAGAICAQSPAFLGVGLGLNGNAHWTSFIAPTVDMTSAFVYTLQGTGLGVVSTGSAVSPRFVSITLAGAASNFPQAVAVS